MTTQFTPILQLALPVTGELNGTWGDVVNDNITSMVEQAIAGLATISTWTTNSHTLTTADGTTDEARCAMIVAQTGAGGTALTGAGEIICPALTKLFVLSNASAYAVTLKTAAGTGISVPSGDTAFLFCDGTNVNPCVTTIVNGHISGNLTVDGNATINGNTTLGNATSDTITATARIASDLNPSADNTYDLGTSGNSWRNLYIDGTATIATLNVTTIDTTNLEVTNIKAKDGTAAITIADTTGVVTGTTPHIISVSSSSDALRITQTGAGNALLVEDSANPDATPFVIDATGNAIQGYTSLLQVANPVGGTALSPSFEIVGSSAVTTPSFIREDASTSPQSIAIAKSRGTLGAPAAVVSGDGIGRISFQGHDGTSFIRASSIDAEVDGTPGTNDMPGRLVFSTTADGASAPTERMRIDSAGRVGIGGTATASTGQVRISNSITGSTTTYGLRYDGFISSDVTAAAGVFISRSTTSAAVFTLGALSHFHASPFGFGAGSTLTNQYGFNADANITGATNNYGFYSNIPSGTGRWNFYAAGSAENYFAGTSSFNANLLVGTTTAKTVVGVTPELQLSSATNAFALITKSQENASGSGLLFGKSRGTEASPTIVVNGDTLGTFYALGYDGTDYIQAATISAAVDGTPGTNDMPGRLVFSTTADGASSPTERMRITSAGLVGIGQTPSITTGMLRVSPSATGGTIVNNIVANSTIASDVTSFYGGVVSSNATAASAFTLAAARHFSANGLTIGAGSTVTNQYGFWADSALTGATNNFGFYSNIASGTGRWNFYAAGTADNYFGGATTISVSTTSDALRITQTGTGNALVVEDSANPDSSPFVVNADGAVIKGALTLYPSIGATPLFQVNGTGVGDSTFAINSWRNSGASGALVALNHSKSGTVGTFAPLVSGDSIGTVVFSGDDGTAFIFAARIDAAVDGTPGTNDMPGRLVFSTTADGASSPTERMRITSSGNVGIGGTPAADRTLLISKNITGATSAYGLIQNGQIQSDVTTLAQIYRSGPSTAATAFTVGTLQHYYAQQGTIGAGSSITTQQGFVADSGLTGATNNYGFYSNIASGTGRWNFYAAGSADNYFAGRVGIGISPGYNLHIYGSQPNVYCESTASSDAKYVSKTTLGTWGSGTGIGVAANCWNVYDFGSSAERMRIDSSGNLIQTTPATAPTLSTNGTMVFNLTSDTNLRVSVRGSDGVTRTANITLA